TPSMIINMLRNIGMFYTWQYTKMLKEYEKLITQAEEKGISEEVLTKAEELKKAAEEEYQRALEISPGSIYRGLGDPRVFMHLRKAYLFLKEAIELLESS
ncbi:MAG: hypothetical protein PWQ32_189, partial [Thermococcaceae archaeon]|nr:hypothetical protein [Thermococcaceae archaeon]